METDGTGKNTEYPPYHHPPTEHQRWPWFFKSGGPGSGLHVTFDGGKSWKRLTDKEGLPKGELGRMGLAISRSNPKIVYAWIESKKNAYYDALQIAQRSNEITPWIRYFVQTVLDAQIRAEQEIEFTLRKTKFFDRFEGELNKRQLKVVRRMLYEGPQGFEEEINARKYVSLTNTSKATATRDLQDLAQKKILIPIGGGRSTRYDINL